MKKLSPKAVKKLNKSFKQTRDIVVVAEHMQYARNVASLFRISDAIGVKKVYLTGVSHHPPFGKDLEKVSRGKEKSVKWQFSESTDKVLESLKAEGYTVVAIEQAEDSKMYTEVDYPEKVAFVLGSEMHGMSKATLALVDDAVILPMFGKGGSINVHVAFAVVAFYASIA